ncbi:MAG: methyl-accepting chemotaxis protein [Hormoscilla sp.]
MGINIQITSKTTRGYLLKKSNVYRDAYQLARTESRQLEEELQELIRDDLQQNNFKNLMVLVNALDRNHQNLIDKVDRGEIAEAVAQWKQDSGREQSQRIAYMLREMLEREDKVVKENKQIQDAALETLLSIVVIVAIISLLFSIATGWLIISGMIARMNQEASAIASASIEIATTVEEQERVAAQQAASVNQTTTTMDELKASSRQSAEQAEAAAAAVSQVLMLASGSTEQFVSNARSSLKHKAQETAQQVLGLSEQINQIYNFTNVVTDLANQTNMLALNAAVEAVRAGEAGKGFGVVAAEIRKLADQSRKSADKINSILGDIQKTTNSTVIVTEDETKAVEEIVAAINEIAINIQQISLNAQQQASAIAQVMTAMNEINSGARETVNGISQTKIGTNNLNQTAQNLKNMV